MDTETTSSENFLTSLQLKYLEWSGYRIPAFNACVAVAVKNMASQSSRCFSLSAGHPAQEVPVWLPLRFVSTRFCNCLRASVCSAKKFVRVVLVLFQLLVASVRTEVPTYSFMLYLTYAVLCILHHKHVQPGCRPLLFCRCVFLVNLGGRHNMPAFQCLLRCVIA